MIHIPIGCKVCRILAISALLLCCMSMQAQFGTYERFTEVLVNHWGNTADDAIYLPAHPTRNFIMTKSPKNGSASVTLTQPAGILELVVDYEPDSNFVGWDTVILEITIGGPPIPLADIYYAEFIFHVVPSIITTQEDYYTIFKGSVGNHFPVSANDSSTASDLGIQSLAAVMGGEYELTGDSLIFHPYPEFEGMAYLTYTVCDSVLTCKSEVVNICVIDTTPPPPSDTIYLATAITDRLTEFLPSSDFYVTLPPTSGSIDFIPNSDAFIYKPGMVVGTDYFEVSDGITFKFYTIDVLPDVVNSFVFDDYYSVLRGDKIEMSVLNNDRTDNFLVNSYTQPDHGYFIEVTNGKFVYQADTAYTGVVTFEYEVCALQNCETGRVHITSSDFAPTQTINIHELTGLINRDLIINYDVPIDDYEFLISAHPTNGIAEFKETVNNGCVESTGRFIIVYKPDSGFDGFDEFTLTYCSADQCTDVVVSVNILDIPVYDTCQCQDKCVWPGDINFDGEVDMTDLLSLGRAIGDMGENRPNPAPDSWYGQFGDDWNEGDDGSPLADEKHCDSDGDGYVTMNDTSSLSMFYGNHHTIIPQEVFTVKPYSIGLEHDLDTTPSIGDTITLYLTVGSPSNPAKDLSGVAMSVSFDPNTVDSAYTTITPVRQNWITREGLPLFMTKDDDINFTMGLSRIDKETNHGYGRVFAMDIIIDDDIDGIRLAENTYPIFIDVSGIAGIDGEGREFMIPDQRLSFQVKIDENDNQVIDHTFNIYPNPARNSVKLDLANIEMTSLSISDIHGHVIRTFEGNIPNEIAVNDLVSGLYIIQANTSQGLKSAKFLKIK